MNLHEGEYVFQVKSIDPFRSESEIAEFTFNILPPWYRTIYAYIGYGFLCLILIGLIIWWIRIRIQISNKKERLKHIQEYRQKEQQFLRESLVKEKEIIKLRNDQLRSKMKHRDKELANQTLNLIQKNQYLLKLKDDFRELSADIKDSHHKSKIAKLVRSIDKEFDNKKQWELFEIAFDEVHEDFLKRLKEIHPSLTPSEMRLCAYLRMNISTKEIAPLMNISVRGVEISRYRLRKKLNLDRDSNLTKFIIEL